MRGQLVGTGVDNGAPSPSSSPPPRPPAPVWSPQPTAHQPWPTAAPPALPPALPAAPTPAPSRPRPAGRMSLVIGACLVLGVGLLGGSVAGEAVHLISTAGGAASASPAQKYAETRAVWHDEPVDDVFPRVVHAAHAGPGGAARTWIRVGVARDAGCVRLLRATYTDVTSTYVTTVGVLVTGTDPAGTTALRHRLRDKVASDPHAMPLPVAFPGTAAAHFGPAQRGSWTVTASGTLPLVVYAVSGFADGRTQTAPQAAAAATARGATTVAAQSGLGYDAVGLAGAVQHHYLSAVHAALDGDATFGAAS
jgi:hypothetical protein